MRFGLVPAAIMTALLAFSGAASADSATGPTPGVDKPEDPAMRPIEHERRAGLVIAFTPGIAFAGSSGYPNDAKLIGNPAYYSESPMLVGATGSLLIMGALTDYLSFGFVINTARFETEKWKSTGTAFGFRAEVYPLLKLVPTFADTAIYGQAGIGGTELQAKGPYPSADGMQSFLGLGVHHEFRFTRLLGGHLSGGPFIEYDAIFAQSAERHWLASGFRLAFYGGTVTADQR
ncbi:MAG: hypothetical protein JST00_03470 [Deltaproteobacteria bacterium]|nr:hypothetical protein [Deltaproteobacteria bacterium]